MVGADSLHKGNSSTALASIQFSSLESGVKTQLFPSTVAIIRISKQESLFIVSSHVCTHESETKARNILCITVKGMGGGGEVCLF